jgi:hypothetical protein
MAPGHARQPHRTPFAGAVESLRKCVREWGWLDRVPRNGPAGPKATKRNGNHLNPPAKIHAAAKYSHSNGGCSRFKSWRRFVEPFRSGIEIADSRARWVAALVRRKLIPCT